MAILRDVWIALGILWVIAAFKVKGAERSESGAQLGYPAAGLSPIRVGFLRPGDATAEVGLAMVEN